MRYHLLNLLLLIALETARKQQLPFVNIGTTRQV